jgi:DNA-binding response OmpR family regulator
MTVEVAFDGEEALKAAESFVPDVVVLDIGMPKLDGLEVCRRIRTHVWGSRPIILAISGTSGAEDRRLTMEAGFDDHLVKPVSPLELFDIVVELAKSKFS